MNMWHFSNSIAKSSLLYERWSEFPSYYNHEYSLENMLFNPLITSNTTIYDILAIPKNGATLSEFWGFLEKQTNTNIYLKELNWKK